MIFLCFFFAFPEPAGICLPRLQFPALRVSTPAQFPGSAPSDACIIVLRLFGFSDFLYFVWYFFWL